MCPVVGDDGLRDAEVGKNVSLVKMEDVLSWDFGQGINLYSLCEVAYPYYKVFVLAGFYHKGSEEV